ncbi:hypothetical protein LINGRAHAP2_LOCUS8621, partial [Linum grandiflorum]
IFRPPLLLISHKNKSYLSLNIFRRFLRRYSGEFPTFPFRMDYMYGETPRCVNHDIVDESILWGDRTRHRAGNIFTSPEPSVTLHSRCTKSNIP